MKKVRNFALCFLCLALLLGAFTSCQQALPDGEETDQPLFTSESRVILTDDEKREIILAYAEYANDPLVTETTHTVRCFGTSYHDYSGITYVVLIEPLEYERITFDEFLESPDAVSITQEAFGVDGVYNFWYDSRTPMLVYKGGNFYGLREAHRDGVVSQIFMEEVVGIYQALNKDFYDAIAEGAEPVETAPPQEVPEDLSKYGRVLVVISDSKSRELHSYTANDFSEIGCVYVADLSTSAGKWARIAKTIQEGKDSIDNYPRSKHNYISTILDKYNQILCLYVEETSEDGILNICDTLKTRLDIKSASPDYEIKLVD